MGVFKAIAFCRKDYQKNVDGYWFIQCVGVQHVLLLYIFKR